MNKNVVFTFALFGFLLFSCHDDVHIDQSYIPDSESVNDIQVVDKNLESHTENMQRVDFIYLFYNQNLGYFRTTLFQDTILYAVDGDLDTAMQNIPAGTGITVLAQNNSRDDLHFLVKKAGDENMWSGWIRSESIMPEVIEIISIPWISEGRWLRLQMFTANSSTRNDFLITETAWNGDFIVVRRDGEILHRIPIEEEFGIGQSGRVAAWTTDGAKAWIQVSMYTTPSKFYLLDIISGELTMFPRPPALESRFAIDPYTGDIWYSDFPFQFCVDTARATKESGVIFHLFTFNFFTRERRIVDTNIGEGFFISFDKSNGFTFERMNFFEED